MAPPVLSFSGLSKWPANLSNLGRQFFSTFGSHHTFGSVNLQRCNLLKNSLLPKGRYQFSSSTPRDLQDQVKDAIFSEPCLRLERRATPEEIAKNPVLCCTLPPNEITDDNLRRLFAFLSIAQLASEDHACLMKVLLLYPRSVVQCCCSLVMPFAGGSYLV